MAKLTTALVEAQARRMVGSRHVHGAVLAVDHHAAPGPHIAAAGDLAPGSQFCAASNTKLIVTIVIMRLVDAGRIALDDPMAAHLPGEMIGGLHLPRYLASVQAEGGMVTTASELATIGRAVFEGRLFDIDALLAQQDWRMIFWPGQFYFGLGMEKLWTPWFISPWQPIRDVMGFWCQTGAFVFHHPATEVTFAGTVNQANGRGHAAAMRAMLSVIRAARR